MSIPESFNLATYLVERHVREGRGDRVALLTATGQTTYAELDALASKVETLEAQNMELRAAVDLLKQDVQLAADHRPSLSSVFNGDLAERPS